MLSYFYNPHKGNIKQHLPNISKGLDKLISKYDNIVIIGDLNSEMSKPLDECIQTYNLKSIINKPTCSKNPKNPSFIDRRLTNKQERFLKSKSVDFHKMVVSLFKIGFKKQKPKSHIVTINVLIMKNSEKVS